MAATATVPQPLPFRNSARPGEIHQSLIPRHGVVTLYGYGISIRVDRGHLILEDGVGSDRRAERFARVNHGIHRVIVIGNDGSVSLAALRWFADQNASFVMLDRDGTVLLTTGPVSSSDARLRRAQACADQFGIAVHIVRELIRKKLAGQEDVARNRLREIASADLIAGQSSLLDGADTVGRIRYLESQAGAIYWSAWRKVNVGFPRIEIPRIPAHWCTFGPRTSPVSGSPRHAANPANAILNYLYAILESETRLAAVALGLDPGLGLLHFDFASRDSLVCDLMEPIRPRVDAFLADWLSRTPLRRNWFFEQRDGTCRLMASLTEQLSETALRWHQEIAPIVEWFAQAVSTASPKPGGLRTGTRLTQRRWREASGFLEPRADVALPQPRNICNGCGAVVSAGKSNCESCALEVARKNLEDVRAIAHQATLNPAALVRRGKSQTRQNEARRAWNPSDLPAWLDNEFYVANIQPRLARFTRVAIASALDVSISYASDIRATRIPHPRHWQRLAELVGI